MNLDRLKNTVLILLFLFLNFIGNTQQQSIARLWNEVLLEAIRTDYARPTVHARNLFHTSIAMYDTWALYNEEATPYLMGNNVHGFSTQLNDFQSTEGIDESMHKTLSYAVYRLLTHRFKNSPNTTVTQNRLDALMGSFNYNTNLTSTDYTQGDPIALGNYIGETIINYGLQDGANELNNYENEYYTPVNDPLDPLVSGNKSINDPNSWQPLTLDVFIDQSGNVLRNNTPEFLGPEWGNVMPFSLSNNSMTTYQKNSNPYKVFYDPGKPPMLDSNDLTQSALYKWGFYLVSIWGSHLTPDDGVLWDISPNSIGNIPSNLFPTNFSEYPSFYNVLEGGAIDPGRSLNPYTQLPYEPQIVLRGDYTRVLAEFWADGPDSETPPGHWFVLLNYINDHPLLEKKLNGKGITLSDLEWDIKAYFMLGGAMHDAAISAWSIKGWYDYIRPISSIRYMAEKGQSSDPLLENYHEDGLPLIENFIEIVENGDALAGDSDQHIGKIKVYTWRGHDAISNPNTDQAGVGWILAENWWPYQRPSFITPPFAGYISGHSTFSRAAAEILTKLTGSAYFPGGMGEFIAKRNDFLVFEEGPSQDITLQWATYRDASDQCSLSRIWGGIHPPLDDIPGRIIGEQIGKNVFDLAFNYFNGEVPVVLHGATMHIYPNPLNNSNELTVSNTPSELAFSLFDITGRSIPFQQQFISSNNETKITTENLSPGIYILRAKTNSWKIIVSH